MSAQKTKAAGHLAAIFTMLIWGTTFISTKSTVYKGLHRVGI